MLLGSSYALDYFLSFNFMYLKRYKIKKRHICREIGHTLYLIKLTISKGEVKMRKVKWWQIVLLMLILALSQIESEQIREFLQHRTSLAFFFHGIIIGFFNLVKSIFDFILSWEFGLLLAVILGYFSFKQYLNKKSV